MVMLNKLKVRIQKWGVRVPSELEADGDLFIIQSETRTCDYGTKNKYIRIRSV